LMVRVTSTNTHRIGKTVFTEFRGNSDPVLLLSQRAELFYLIFQYLSSTFLHVFCANHLLSQGRRSVTFILTKVIFQQETQRFPSNDTLVFCISVNNPYCRGSKRGAVFSWIQPKSGSIRLFRWQWKACSICALFLCLWR